MLLSPSLAFLFISWTLSKCDWAPPRCLDLGDGRWLARLPQDGATDVAGQALTGISEGIGLRNVDGYSSGGGGWCDGVGGGSRAD